MWETGDVAETGTLRDAEPPPACRISIITTCRSRLAHLKQTLPLMLRQSAAEVIVVDYGCPEGTGDWVSAEHPGVRLVRVPDDTEFNAARARNHGAAVARAATLCFTDADVLLRGDLGAWLDPTGCGGSYWLAAEKITKEPQLGGFVICSAPQFHDLGGYDEAIRGWGGEDVDLYERLDAAGVAQRRIPAGMVSVIQHGDELRQLGAKHPEVPLHRAQTVRMNKLYRRVKHDVAQELGRHLSLPERREIRHAVQSAYELVMKTNRSRLALEICIPAASEDHATARSRQTLRYVERVPPQGGLPLWLWKKRKLSRRLLRSLAGVLSRRGSA